MLAGPQRRCWQKQRGGGRVSQSPPKLPCSHCVGAPAVLAHLCQCTCHLCQPTCPSPPVLAHLCQCTHRPSPPASVHPPSHPYCVKAPAAKPGSITHQATFKSCTRPHCTQPYLRVTGWLPGRRTRTRSAYTHPSWNVSGGERPAAAVGMLGCDRGQERAWQKLGCARGQM